jgi:hypothetical protein
MKSLDFLEQADHNRKAAIYVAAHDGKLRNFAYTEELGECRETFSRLLQDVQEGEIGVVLTHDAACLAIEASPGWMEAFISPEEYEKERSAPRPLADAIAQSPFAAAYIERDENWFLVTRLEGKGADAAIYGLSSVAIGQDVDMFGLGWWKELLEIMAPLPHVVASFFARWPYKRKAGHYPNWNGFYLLLYRDVEDGWKLMRIRRDTSC